jgi:hypothetical protein
MGGTFGCLWIILAYLASNPANGQRERRSGIQRPLLWARVLAVDRRPES